jgi:hypothetical protein
MAEPDKKVDAANQMTGAVCLVRLIWMMFGNGALIICIGVIAAHKGSFLSVADAVFWVVVLALIWLRYVDITRMKGMTVFAQPATLSHWKRYVCLLLGFSLAAWAAAHTLDWFRG